LRASWFLPPSNQHLNWPWTLAYCSSFGRGSHLPRSLAVNPQSSWTLGVHYAPHPNTAKYCQAFFCKSSHSPAFQPICIIPHLCNSHSWSLNSRCNLTYRIDFPQIPLWLHTAYLRDSAESVPDHCNKVNIT
jgi:hypothetical protein